MTVGQISGCPRVYGTGLIALDLVVSQDRPKGCLWAGGTCGNVLSILAFLGWEAFPVGRLRRDRAADYVRADLERRGVRLDFLHLEPASDTPVILQRIIRDASGVPFHTFSWRCPHCGGRFPRYSAVPQTAIRSVLAQVDEPRVFFLDRVSRGALALAEACVEQGAIVVFEPSGVGEVELFREALRVSHILKYSHERMRAHLESAELEIDEGGPLLEIETLGRGGLSYRCRLGGYTTTGWERVAAFRVNALRDTSGAGDWCTAGIVSRLASNGSVGLRSSSRSDVIEALAFGQALAAWNCGFEGARGGMDTMSREQLLVGLSRILQEKAVDQPTADPIPQEAVEVLHGICSRCLVQPQGEDS